MAWKNLRSVHLAGITAAILGFSHDAYADGGNGHGGENLQCSGDSQVTRGRDLWIKATFGGEKFFSKIMPNPPFSLVLGLDVMLRSPRATRFDDWGVVNDPDCRPGDASTFGFDKCKDPNSAGTVGVRKFPNPSFNASQPPSATNPPVLIGVSCAACHAGLDPQNPPANPNEPRWENIHLTTGNQFDQIGEIFAANLSPNDPRYQVFHSWAPGTVDTTAIENDGINNPGIITQFYEFPKRPYFDHHYFGVLGNSHRAGQGGEDDVGCELASLRVYFNIGMCAAECMIPHLSPQSPIDLTECEQRCPDLRDAEAKVGDLCAFINDAKSTPAPALEKAPHGKSFIDKKAAKRGEGVFAHNCASCHSNGKKDKDNSWTNDLPLPATGFNPTIGEPPGAIGTQKCRSLSTNWLTGRIWQNFSSDELKQRGPGYYRNVPLLGVWATAPFLHNNRLGEYSGDPSVAGRVATFEEAFDELLNPGQR
ncbi:MAG TPA: hypothetical protein VG963_21935, partial [Polyangiaceae bacterium]|nr:hypothetical protein [Polyangiaceae bacterium]